MSVCLSCAAWCRGRLCPTCAGSLTPAPDRLVGGTVLVRAAFRHEGAARVLVHRMKYEGVACAADILARAMTPLIPDDVVALVPVPRVLVRRIAFGVDGAGELASRLCCLTGLPVIRALGAPPWARRHAGQPGKQRNAIRLRSRRANLPMPYVLVDDVVTTGGTLLAAVPLLPGPPALALVATSAGRMGSRHEASPSSTREPP